MRLQLLMIITVFCLAGSLSAEERLVEFRGTGSKLTDEFRVKGPWLLDYSITSEYSSETGIEIDLVESEFLSHRGVVLRARNPGAGTKLFREAGLYRFRVTSTAASWRLRVSTISKEEADAMIVK
ncbi:MAG: hypothetical protein KJO35_06665 [Gammaproteobacteria bacterium]|nr:hypothetical protein [Gammaproteobacteria bacterium]NNF66472.1 hypothetical protein [Gammaproteobacteria bacterium]